MRFLFIALLSLLSLSSVAQSAGKTQRGYVRGQVYYKESDETIPYATIRILSQADSTQIRAVATDTTGRFNIPLPLGSYIFEASFMGRKSYSGKIDLSAKEPGVTLGKIYLEESAISLDAAIVEVQVPNIVVRGDTIEYNAGSYTAEESDMLQDIIRNIPGIEVNSNGTIVANGKPVKKILVDGKEFFGNDIPMALANLPANMIKKLQLYKEESETAKITGFKDKNPDQVINLVVKEELKQSIFGDVRAGYGSDNKYSNKVSANYMRNDNQISVIGDLNNVNGDDMSAGLDNGIDKNKNLGANAYFHASKKFKIGGNIRYSNNENLMETKTNTQTFLSTGDRYSVSDMSTLNTRESFNMGMNLQWKPDSMTTVFARSYANFNNTHSENSSADLSYVIGGDTTSGNSLRLTRGDGLNVNNFVTVGRKLDNKGRVLSFTFNNSIRKDDSKGSNYSLTQYTDNTPDKVIDQLTNTNSRTNSYNLSASYVEPLGKDYRLKLSYSYNRNDSKRERDVRRKDDDGNYTVVDTAYTRNTKNRYITQSISLNFQADKEKYRYTLGFSIDPSSSSSNVTMGDSIIENLKQRVINFSPSLNFSYMPNDNSSFDFSYSGATSQPSLSQLSADTIIVSALSKRYGNPNLKPSYSNNLNAYYQKSNYETGRFFMISTGFNYTFNNIVNYTLIDDKGNTTDTYKNVSGNLGANLNVMYDTPLKNKKFSINNTTYINFYKNIGYSNGDKAITNNWVLSEQIMAKFKSSKVETSLRAGITHSTSRNNLTDLQNRSTTNYNLYHFLQIRLPFDFSIQSNLSYSYYSGYENDFKNSELLWNASVSKHFLKKKRGTLKAQFYDILNDRNNLTRIVTGNYISDARTNTVNQYFMVSFSYRFNIIKGKSKKSGEENDYEDY
ncbi:TonB-dependent receptor [Dysgonomonas sp. 511]|uniref:TonB-dependent receptor domain-containing protein n=1 Tax=Dysgonomonas sp. 511 TaxID=2302930 RepID=UPI0013D12EEE|nr:TonB-dependent receptor [Dysgonomonas sp. 511]NDV78684.1 TonB-dependent receptor [Dysgonomonas sp. 511]